MMRYIRVSMEISNLLLGCWFCYWVLNWKVRWGRDVEDQLWEALCPCVEICWWWLIYGESSFELGQQWCRCGRVNATAESTSDLRIWRAWSYWRWNWRAGISAVVFDALVFFLLICLSSREYMGARDEGHVVVSKLRRCTWEGSELFMCWATSAERRIF